MSTPWRVAAATAVCSTGFAVFAGPFAAAALPAPDGYVVDTADAVSPATEERLELELADLEQRTSAEVAVAVVRSMENRSVENYARALFDEWGVGQRGTNNGALLVVALDDRKLRIEVGDGLRDRVPDRRAAEIVETEVVPRLRSGDVDGAVSAGVIGIRRGLGDDVTNPDTPPAHAMPPSGLIAPGEPDDFSRLSPGLVSRGEPGASADDAFGAFVVIAIVLAIAAFVAKAAGSGGAFASDACPTCRRPLGIDRSDTDAGGERVYRDRCAGCGFTRVRSRHASSGLSTMLASPGWAPTVDHDQDRRASWFSSSGSESSSFSSSSSSDSSGSSFGGGSSSGGGASGSW